MKTVKKYHQVTVIKTAENPINIALKFDSNLKKSIRSSHVTEKLPGNSFHRSYHEEHLINLILYFLIQRLKKITEIVFEKDKLTMLFHSSKLTNNGTTEKSQKFRALHSGGDELRKASRSKGGKRHSGSFNNFGKIQPTIT